MSNKENRRRTETLTIRLTKAEKEFILKRAKKAKMNVTNYLVTLSLETPIQLAEDVKPLLLQMKRIGNNLNQIATKINSGVVHSVNFYDVLDAQKEIYKALYAIARKN